MLNWLISSIQISNGEAYKLTSTMTASGQRQQSGSGDIGSKYVLKRIFTERGPRVRLAGLREAYFGRLLQNDTAVLQVAVAD